jgi:hypothetical protein
MRLVTACCFLWLSLMQLCFNINITGVINVSRLSVKIVMFYFIKDSFVAYGSRVNVLCFMVVNYIKDFTLYV